MADTEETIRSIARLHAEHHQNATPLQRAVDRITGLLGRPRFIGALTVVGAGWISLNLLAAALGYRPIDPPPFPGLQGAVASSSSSRVNSPLDCCAIGHARGVLRFQDDWLRRHKISAHL